MDRAQHLEDWLRTSPGGYVHPDLHLAEDIDRGVHWKAGAELSQDTKILTIPHSFALSYLNALVDDAYPVFKARRKDFTVEAIGFFYLMLQYINRSSSFWKLYLDTLPPPSALTTPLWFDDDGDAEWLSETDVEHTMSKRRRIYEDYYASGTAIIAASGVDTSQFSWDCFRWAITMFTSRSFPSRSIAPDGSKYWTTYKTGSNGQRQTVLLDMSHTPAEDLDFSVLFPVIDAGNHNHRTRVHWDFDPGRFSITALDVCPGGAEVCNNYGPKANDELLQGYGFCIEDNPYDVVLLTLRPPPSGLQDQLRITHSGYFDAQGVWQADKATFRLPRPTASSVSAQIFDDLPQALLELLVLTIRFEAGSVVDTSAADYEMLRQRYRPHAARLIMSSLAQKLHRLDASRPVFDPTRSKQLYARLYRQAQSSIATAYIQALQGYMQSLTPAYTTGTPSSTQLVTLEDVAADASLLAEPLLQDFLGGIEANANTSDISQLRLAGWEDDVWVLLLCYAWLSRQTNQDEKLSYLASITQRYHNRLHLEIEEEVDGQADELLSLVHTAAAHLPSTLWASPHWSAATISRIGGKAFKNESFVLPFRDEAGDPEPRVTICISSVPEEHETSIQ